MTEETGRTSDPSHAAGPSDSASPAVRRWLPVLPVRDDVAYILPIAVFLGFTVIGGQWPSLYPLSYVMKTVAVAVLLGLMWRHYTPIRWDYWWLGIIVGVVGLVQWIGMEKLLLNYVGNYHILSAGPPFNPYQHFDSALVMWGFIAVRWAGASLLVPVMEELFWRDYLWRTIIAPNNFKLAYIGEWDLKAFLIVAAIFGAAVHIEWATAIVYGLLIGWLLVRTRSLGACIIAHGVTNFLLGLYVLVYQDWAFW